MANAGEPDPGTAPVDPTARGCWESFHDRLDADVHAMADGEFLELSSERCTWRIRLSAGWPGVDGPGTLAYHLQIGSNLRGRLGAWASTPYARSHGYSATRVAGEISALGLESDPTGITNPSMIACGAVAHLEVADVAVELLREVFEVTSSESVTTSFGNATANSQECRTGAPELAEQPDSSVTGQAMSWWSRIAFDPQPEVDPDHDQVVGRVDNVLVELTRDSHSLPGLTLLIARARLTDPNAVPVALPAGDAAALLRWMRNAGGDGITVDTVRSGGGTVHGWATRMVCSDGNDGRLGRIDALDGPADDEQAAAAAAAEVVGFVKTARRRDPQVIRPTRLMAAIGD